MLHCRVSRASGLTRWVTERVCWLQVETAAGVWSAVPGSVEGSRATTAVVMVGRTLEHATGGILKATIHRVPQASMGRLSVAFRQRAHRLAKLDAAMLREGEASSAPKGTWYFMVARKARTERGVCGGVNVCM